LTEEAVVAICPNPRCQKEIEEPILLTILSVTPPKQYQACPCCFAKLEQESSIEHEEVPEPQIELELALEKEEEKEIEDNLSVNVVLEKVKDSGPRRFFKKVKALIPNNGGLKENEENTKEPQAEPAVKKEELKEAIQTDLLDKDETVTEEPKIEEIIKKESGLPTCPETFGYLSNRPKDVPIPQGCLTCLKMVDCMLSPKEY